MSCEHNAPRISIVTPSFNQGQFLEATIRSVLNQNYPNLEYIIMDGGSTDNSVEIIKKYAGHLAYWKSERDRGQNHAITEGFKRATGDIFAYLNPDVIYFPWTLQIVGQVLTQLPRVQWLTSQTTVTIDAAGDPLTVNYSMQQTRLRFYSGMTLGNFFGESGWIQQGGTFWRRELWEKAGAYMDETLERVGDFDLWARMYQHGELTGTRIPLAAYRQHRANNAVLDLTIAESRAILSKYPDERKLTLNQFRFFRKLHKQTGRFNARYGSQFTRVQYDLQNDKWILFAEPII